ncbi:MAG: single-stranded-DNA-specific exonuclease RecJ [Christensenellales bacterium]|jgi:single-stranded-DNA-specific exonuclease RecJ
MKFLKYYDKGIKDAVISDFSLKFGLDKKIIKLIVARGYTTEAEIQNFLNPSFDHLNDPFKLKNMDKALERIFEAIAKKERILIFGDYDVDGVSATAIMIKTFEKLNYKVYYYLPNRYVDGYGLTNQVLDKIRKQYNPSLIITVDCGITCHDEVEYAKTLGIDIIITDHHEVGGVLPQTIVLNAKIEGQEYPFRELCGTGLAFKISQAMIGERAKEFLPIAAIATIADIVPLKAENRAIVKLGLDLMEQYCPPGIKAMIKGQKLNFNDLTSVDIAFKIAPKLNASGRMGDAQDSLILYLEKNPVKIKTLIDDILTHNTDRQALCNLVYIDCKKQLENVNMSKTRSIVLQSKNWDQGILGIVCARLLDEYNRPVFLFSNENGLLKGSARSMPELNVHILLSDMQDILETFGGHTVAAGLTLKESCFEEFKTRVNSYIVQHISDDVFKPISYYDEELCIDEINENFVKSLKVLEPFGCENQPPRFKICCLNVSINPMKNFINHANLLLGKKLNLVAFNYLQNYYKIKYAKGKSFIFEFQESKYKNPYIKGLLKDFTSNFGLDGKNFSNVETLVLNQLRFLNLKNTPTYFEFTQKDILMLLNKAALSAFGTCFVFYNQETLKEFTNKYEIENFYNFDVGENTSKTGFNSFLFAPVGTEWAKNYETIIFMDPVLDKGFISKINQLTTAQVFVPADRQFDKKIFDKIYTSRENFGRIYNIFKRIDNKEFMYFEDMYGEFYKNKVNFQDFFAAFLVFSELEFIKLERNETLKIKVLSSNQKQVLQQSNIFNFINLMKNIK